jgi:putative ABC transport system permease protein
MNDLRFALRLLLKQPGFTAIAVLALGVGIGLATAVFNSFSGIMLRPVPHIVDEDRIVYVNPFFLNAAGNDLPMAAGDFFDLRAETKTLEGMMVTRNRTMVLGGEDKPERLASVAVSPGGLGMLGARPLLGRVFNPEEEKLGAAPTAVLSYHIWHRRFGGRDDIVGHVAMINGQSTTIVGVMPEGFRFPELADAWEPLPDDPKDPNSQRGNFGYSCYARLKPGVSFDQAQAELTLIGARYAKEFSATNDGISFRLRLYREQLTGEIAPLMRLMLGAVGFVLLIACANVANLLLAKAASRSREIAIRASLGATRGRIVRQVLTESLLLGLLGGALSLLLSVWGNQLLLNAVPVDIPAWMTFGFDWRVFAFAFFAALASSVTFGIFPALQVSLSTSAELKEGGRGNSGGPKAHRIRNGLVVSQVALALVLLIGAGLMVRSFLKLQSAPYGFEPAGVLTFRVGLPPAQFKDPAGIRRFFEQLTPRLAEIPGVESAAGTSLLPSLGMNINAFIVEGRPRPKTLLEAPYAVNRFITPDYFKALKIPLLRGRTFTDDDRFDKPKVAVIDQGFADKWFPGEDPIGKRINSEYDPADPTTDNKPENWITIVGVVGTVPQSIASSTVPKFSFYQPVAQGTFNFLSYALRVKGDPASYSAPAQQAVLGLQREIPIYQIQTLSRAVANSYWQKKFFGVLFSVFGFGALFLSSIGLYGVMAYSVTERTSEIGVRMALGAQPSDVIRLVGRQGAWLVGLGIAFGLIAALGLTRLMSGALFGVSASDPATYLALSLILAAVGALACWIPARRATRVDPVIALRGE